MALGGLPPLHGTPFCKAVCIHQPAQHPRVRLLNFMHNRPVSERGTELGFQTTDSVLLLVPLSQHTCPWRSLHGRYMGGVAGGGCRLWAFSQILSHYTQVFSFSSPAHCAPAIVHLRETVNCARRTLSASQSHGHHLFKHGRSYDLILTNRMWQKIQMSPPWLCKTSSWYIRVGETLAAFNWTAMLWERARWWLPEGNFQELWWLSRSWDKPPADSQQQGQHF